MGIVSGPSGKRLSCADFVPTCCWTALVDAVLKVVSRGGVRRKPLILKAYILCLQF